LAEDSHQAFYNKLLKNNLEWAKEKLDIDPDFFLKQAKGQRPPILWIGCSDSRVPADVIIGA
jgi:carbonic anhydrase